MANYNGAPEKFSNTNLNSVGSKYSSDFSHDTSILIEKITNKAIFDAAPQQFMDLKLLNMKSAVFPLMSSSIKKWVIKEK